ncbi:hypothetical protein TNCV_68131 [Trichonephila clavipes]|nr:hypothetical protein TNCV_68131 [Trichonephila clavipes]
MWSSAPRFQKHQGLSLIPNRPARGSVTFSLKIVETTQDSKCAKFALSGSLLKEKEIGFPNFKSVGVIVEKLEFSFFTPTPPLLLIRFPRNSFLAEFYSTMGTLLPNFKSVALIISETSE